MARGEGNHPNGDNSALYNSLPGALSFSSLLSGRETLDKTGHVAPKIWVLFNFGIKGGVAECFDCCSDKCCLFQILCAGKQSKATCFIGV